MKNKFDKIYYYYYYFFLNKIIKQKHNILEEDKDEEGIKCKKKIWLFFVAFQTRQENKLPYMICDSV